jgi:hypothetical protein
MDQRPVDGRARRDNLDAPLPGDRGAHGDFDARAKQRSLELWARRHAGPLLAAAAVVALLAWKLS